MAFQLVEAKKKAGYTAYTALAQYRDKYFPVVLYFETHGSKKWNEKLSQEYRAYLKRRVDNNEFSGLFGGRKRVFPFPLITRRSRMSFCRAKISIQTQKAISSGSVTDTSAGCRSPGTPPWKKLTSLSYRNISGSVPLK